MEVKVLYSEEKIKERIKELAKQIEKENDMSESVVICILKGAIYFFTELTKNFDGKIFIDCIQAKSYSGTQSTNMISYPLRPSLSFKDKNVILIEDIIDTGMTLDFLKQDFIEKGAKDVKICVLLDKEGRRTKNEHVKPDYVGFEIPNLFVVGYGMDYDEIYRNLPFIGYIEEDECKKTSKIKIMKK